MSIDATRWSWTASVKTSAQRLVLLSLADRAGEEHTAWPSIDRLAADTMLDKK
ncbi:helix-turn-helix domain-containing protein, partial [Acinetobacter baumannii]